MTPEDIRAALQATLTWENPPQVHITGGEAFLNFPLLLQSIEIAVELGISCYIETNAGWCVRPSLVAERFRQLREAGLQAVLISCSPFHAAAIPLQRTLLAIQQAQQIFGRRGTIVYLSEWIELISRFGTDNTVPLERYVDVFGEEQAGDMLWRGYGLISGGRSAYRLERLTRRWPAETLCGETCRSEILHARHSHFDLYGNYISGFCGGLAIGSWRDLPQLNTASQLDSFPPLINILVKSGPYGLYELASQEYAYTPLAGGYAGKCHLCVDVRRALFNSGDFDELRPARFYEPQAFV